MLDATFGALADSTRRAILERLAGGGQRVTDLARPFAMTLPAVSKHVRMLESAGLVTRTRLGREHHIQIAPKPLRAARTWIDLYADVWTHQLDALAAYLKENPPTDPGILDPERP